MNDNDSKWVPVKNVDVIKRKPTEWASIYNIKIMQSIKNELWNEYEWAYNMLNMQYMPLPDRDKDNNVLDSYEKSIEMEMRAMELKRDLFMGADMGEKYVLEKQYIETEWLRKRQIFVN